MILGIDEVGRGPWAGPLVVGAVVLSQPIEGLTDSKKLSAPRREVLAEEVYQKAAAWGLGWVSAEEIDEIGLSASLRLATIRAVEQITVPYHEIIIDGTINFLADTAKGAYVTTLKKADLLIPEVSAASIIAKVARDTFMAEQDAQYPGYGFGKHVGYGTAQHRQALSTLGVTPLHRASFAPIAALVGKTPPASLSTESKTSTVAIGHRAEERVAEYLQAKGHQLIELNWRTRYCEIDLITQLEDTYYFTEVKYRSSSKQGGGLAAITADKIKRMARAAEVYTVKAGLANMPVQLAVASVSEVGVEEYLRLDESLAH